MTDEEMAATWVKENADSCRSSNMNAYEFAEQAFLAGLKSGRPKWHKVSEQIPTEEKEYLVKLTDGTVDVMTVALDGDLEPYLLTPKFDFYKDVEKWCEIPPEESE
jgi:hypothetical protein